MVFFMSSELRREVIFHFVDIPVGGNVDHHCLSFLFIACSFTVDPPFNRYLYILLLTTGQSFNHRITL
jgi:hypothetical protein